MTGSKYDIFRNDVLNYYNLKYSDTQISDILQIDSRRVGEIRKNLGLKTYEEWELKPNIKFNDQQEQIMIGGILGDSCIFKDKRSQYHRLQFAHSLNQKEYFLFKYNIFKDLFNCYRETITLDKRTNNTYYAIVSQSITHPILSDYYNKWYKDKRKVVPNDIYILNDFGLAIFYLDDGYKHIVENKYMYEISVNDYDKESVDKIQDMLYKNFSIETTYQERGVIHILVKCNEIFENLVRPYLTPDVQYKLKSIK
jgi:hypothetical protein